MTREIIVLFKKGLSENTFATPATCLISRMETHFIIQQLVYW